MRSKIALRVALIFMALMVHGCSTSQADIGRDYQLKPDAGVVVFSLTTSGECGYALFVDIRSIDRKKETTVGLQEMFAGRDWERKSNACDPDSDDYSGKLKVISLKKGVYEIYKLTGISRNGSFSTDDKLSIQFTVEGGKTTYLGNANFHISKGRYSFEISDKRNRDIELFEKKYPGRAENIVIDILKTAILIGA